MIRADEVKRGDELLVARKDGSLLWDTVATGLFQQEPDGLVSYLHIEATNNVSITITANHYMHSGPACCDSTSLVQAGSISIGDIIWTHSGTAHLTPATVTAISHVQHEGAYNFLLDQAGDTHFRSLVANGVVASSITDEWRLIGSFGFDVADRLRDPLRAMARLAGPDDDRISPEVTRVVVNATRRMEDVVADCLEDHLLHDCSESDMEAKFAVIDADARSALPADVHGLIAGLVEQLAQQHLSYLPSPLRRVLASVTTSRVTGASWVVVKMAAHEAHEIAIRACASDASCAADMEKPSSPQGPMLYLAIGAASMLVLMMAMLAVGWACISLKRMHKTNAQKADEEKADKTGVEKTVVEKVDVEIS